MLTEGILDDLVTDWTNVFLKIFRSVSLFKDRVPTVIMDIVNGEVQMRSKLFLTIAAHEDPPFMDLFYVMIQVYSFQIYLTIAEIVPGQFVFYIGDPWKSMESM